jgi:Family of unknown function (DUF6982)
MELIKVVVRYADGKVIKGYTYDFFPNKAIFHFYPAGGETSGGGTEISIRDLKSVFFVRDFDGNPGYDEQKQFAPDRVYTGRKVEVKFADGETLTGSTMGYAPDRPGFFLSPADPMSNNLRVFVINASVAGFRYL